MTIHVRKYQEVFYHHHSVLVSTEQYNALNLHMCTVQSIAL